MIVWQNLLATAKTMDLIIIAQNDYREKSIRIIEHAAVDKGEKLPLCKFNLFALFRSECRKRSFSMLKLYIDRRTYNAFLLTLDIELN